MLKEKRLRKNAVLSLSYTALGAAIIAVCAWISIPFAVPFTLQTFAVFAISGILGWKRSVSAVLIYIAAGLLGVPVFAGFNAGPGVIFGVTGGYIIGFIFTALAVGLITDKIGIRLPVLIISMIIGLILCYAFGTVWFVHLYSKNTGEMGYLTALSKCVVPYILPDVCKIILASFIVPRIKRQLKI